MSKNICDYTSEIYVGWYTLKYFLILIELKYNFHITHTAPTFWTCKNFIAI